MGRRSSDSERLPPNVTAFTDRHGKRRYRYRKQGEHHYSFKDHPGTPKHPSEEYKAVVAGLRPSKISEAAGPHTIRDLINRYYSTPEYTGPGVTTQEKVRARLEDFCKAHGSKPVTGLRFSHVEAILSAKAKVSKNAAGKKIGGPNAAKSLEKDLTRIFDLAVRLEWITTNPLRLARRGKVPKTPGSTVGQKKRSSSTKLTTPWERWGGSPSKSFSGPCCVAVMPVALARGTERTGGSMSGMRRPRNISG